MLTSQKIRFGSVCSGIEAASVAWMPIGWEAAWLSEIEPFACAVLAHHYPNTPNIGDMTTIAARILSGDVEAPDVLCGGTPCQSFSVAGMRKSLSDARGSLVYSFIEIANAIDTVRARSGKPPCVVLWENVPGALSTRDNAFGCFLAGLAGEDMPLQPAGGKWTNAGCVYGAERTISWRVLDSQYFGLAQRRNRVFVVASAGAVSPAEILFEREGCRRDSAPGRKAGEDFAGHFAQSIAYGCGNTSGCINIAGCLTHHASRLDFDSETFVVHGTQNPDSLIDCAHTIGRNHGQENVVSVSLRCRDGGATAELGGRAQNCLRASNGGGDKPHVLIGNSVRRLTPEECELLQGFPRGYTRIPLRGKPAEQCSDSPRYRAIGNSWAVPVVRWIGKRINREVERARDETSSR